VKVSDSNPGQDRLKAFYLCPAGVALTVQRQGYVLYDRG